MVVAQFPYLYAQQSSSNKAILFVRKIVATLEV